MKLHLILLLKFFGVFATVPPFESHPNPRPRLRLTPRNLDPVAIQFRHGNNMTFTSAQLRPTRGLLGGGLGLGGSQPNTPFAIMLEKNAKEIGLLGLPLLKGVPKQVTLLLVQLNNVLSTLGLGRNLVIVRKGHLSSRLNCLANCNGGGICFNNAKSCNPASLDFFNCLQQASQLQLQPAFDLHNQGDSRRGDGLIGNHDGRPGSSNFERPRPFPLFPFEIPFFIPVRGESAPPRYKQPGFNTATNYTNKLPTHPIGLGKDNQNYNGTTASKGN